ncbi:MAG: hypothetical protein U9R11_03335 [Chloroflexota bacterium]|nr:hypothetical protein [Chloroflexota bacterium]
MIYLGVFLLSMATLAFEITLTRIFSLAQWYHFAFMSVSIALLGFGASGSLLSLFSGLVRRNMPKLSALFSASVVASYLTANYVPFDSYRIAWEPVQFLYLAIYFLSLTLPFFFCGLTVGILLAEQPELASKVYSFNMVGSALGCLAAASSFSLLGGEGTVMLCALLGVLAAGAFWAGRGRALWNCAYSTGRGQRAAPTATECRECPPSHLLPAGILYLLIVLALLFLTTHPPSFLEVRLSPYKGLSQTMRYPETRIIFRRWNAFSRVDVVESGCIRSAPGLSLTYPEPPPPQLGIFTDGGNLLPITAMDEEKMDFINYLPTSLPYLLRPGAKALIIEPKGGLDVLTALRKGASSVTAVESNPLIVETVRTKFGDFAGGIYGDPRVEVVAENGRSYIRRTREKFDLIQLSLADTYRPVTSGAYSLSESYLYTVEAFADCLDHLNEGGLLVVARWLQTPPSESLRAGALAVTALERMGVQRPEQRLAVIRSLQTALILVKKGDFTPQEIETVKGFCEERKFDLVHYPGMTLAEANRYNVLPEPSYYLAFQELLGGDRSRFYAAYPFDVTPPTDDKPFFLHFFKWSQAPAILRTYGKVWQPFGGSGYFVLVALFLLALLASAMLILLPLAFRAQHAAPLQPSLRWPVFAYFALLGLGYLFIELPLMQRYILFLGQPTYSFAAVLGAILLFSGLGSLASPRLPLKWTLPALVVLILLYPLFLPHFFRLFLAQSLGLRLLASLLSLTPLGFLMGMPFPKGIEVVNKVAPDLIPWAWGVNGCASVLASILATTLAVSFGFDWVLVAAGLAYAVGLAAILSTRRAASP